MLVIRDLICCFLIVFYLCTFNVNALNSFPADSEVTIVAENIYMKGKQVSIWQVKSPLNHGQHANFYIEQWKGNGENFGVQELDSEIIVSKFESGHLYTAQVSQNYPHSVALVSKSSEPSNQLIRAIRKIDDLPKPAGSEVINEIKAKDGAKHSITVVMSNPRNIADNLNFYLNYLNKKGFIVERTLNDKRRKQGVILARKGPNEFNATFQTVNNKTIITAVKVDADI